MSLKRLFIDTPLLLNSEVCLNQDQTHYIVHVLRMKISESLIFFNGDGYEYTGTYLNNQKKQALFCISTKKWISRESDLTIHLAQGIAKSDNMDTIIQKATELGVKTITPLFADHSQLKINPHRVIKKKTHWNRVIQSACMQCGRNELPILCTPTTIKLFVNSYLKHPHFMFTPTATQKFSDMRINIPEITFLIGPEGGFSKEEINLAKENGMYIVSLGPRILRTETAAICAISMFEGLFGEY